MAGGGQYPFPKQVWSPSGGWWSRPANWKANTAITATGLAIILYGVWQFSAKNEVRIRAPNRAIPSQRWSQQARDMGIRVE
ncbi:hypothetical protein BCR39DRAFT_554627 [Naematelia encephala]|uniref:Uncharacterized protein n=1 Tax=Naematelia encephala TaxID=71784 RepID=A0A1Y2AE79_9TREE|nr:hypothetical protein BCR39DRAFT_554627 [Naematelia encephala]